MIEIVPDLTRMVYRRVVECLGTVMR